MGQTPRPRLRYAATVAALLSVLLQAWLVVAMSATKLGPVQADPETIAWLALSGAPICHGAQPSDDETPGHTPKPIAPCLICAGLQGVAPVAQAKILPAFVAVEIALTYHGEAERVARDVERTAFDARGPPARFA